LEQTPQSTGDTAPETINDDSQSADKVAPIHEEAPDQPDVVPADRPQDDLGAKIPESIKTSAGEASDMPFMSLLVDQKRLVSEQLERFAGQLNEHLRSTTSCSRVAFDRLYEEMQSYKRNFLLEAQRPLLMDLMMLYDSIDTLRRNYSGAAPVDPAVLCQNLDSLQVEAEEILQRVGIERMTATPERLDVNLQKTVKAIPTAHAEEHLQVVERLRSGFLSGEKPFRKEQVIIRTYDSTARQQSPAAASVSES